MKDNNLLKEKTKYILIGIVIGILIGIAIFYLLTMLRVIQPFGFFGFGGNFSRTFPRGSTP